MLIAAAPAPSPPVDVLHMLAPLWPLWLAVGLILAGRLGRFLWRERRLRHSGIHEIKEMSGEQFERRLVLLFRDLGYHVEHTGKRGDFGADLIVTKGKQRTVVQAKRWAKNVGVKAVQEANTARSMYQAKTALVVTSGGYTKAARKLAASANVELWAEPELVSRLLRVRGNPQPEQPTVGASPAAPTDEAAAPTAVAAGPVREPAFCARCGKPISERVRDFCLGHRERFAGLVYCFEHQRGFRS